MTLAFFSEDDLAEKLKNIGALIPFSKLASQLRVQHEEVAVWNRREEKGREGRLSSALNDDDDS